jgi:adenylate cyclase
MQNQIESRQLAAIVFTDIVGYTRMMDADEVHTTRILNEQRELAQPLVQKHNGKILKEMGDGLLMIFPSVIEAVRCALEMLNMPRSYELRVGIHIGDVIVRDNDVFGSGVNVAARVESEAEPDGICITHDVWRQIRNQTDLRARSIGVRALKGVSEPMELFSLIHGKESSEATVVSSVSSGKEKGGEVAPGSSKKSQTGTYIFAAVVFLAIIAALMSRFSISDGDGFIDLPDGYSVAVLPLQNLSLDPDDAFFTDGVHEDIIIQLTKIENLKVIARSSVTGYASQERDLRRIGSELGVRTVMEGSVRRAGNQIRVAVQLIDIQSNRALWAETYDRNLTDLFGIQRDIATEIASALKISLRPVEVQELERRVTENTRAYTFFLQGREYENRPGYVLENLATAVQLYERAIELDPGFALAYARSAVAHSTIYWFSLDRSETRIAAARAAALQARRLDGGLAESLYASGLVRYWFDTDYDGAIALLEQALEKQPNNSDFLLTMGAIYRRKGDFSEGIRFIERGVELNPRAVNNVFQLALSQRFNKNFDEAIYWFERTLELAPDFYLAELEYISLKYDLDGDLEAFRRDLQRLPPNSPSSAEIWWYKNLIARNFDELLAFGETLDYVAFEGQNAYRPIRFAMGVIRYKMGDMAGAMADLEFSRDHLEWILANRGDDPRAHATLGRTYALLGDRDKAIYHGHRATEITPVERDILVGSFYLVDLSITYSFLGDAARAVEILNVILELPTPVTLNWLKVFPEYDNIRSSPEFQTLIGGNPI